MVIIKTHTCTNGVALQAQSGGDDNHKSYHNMVKTRQYHLKISIIFSSLISKIYIRHTHIIASNVLVTDLSKHVNISNAQLRGKNVN